MSEAYVPVAKTEYEFLLKRDAMLTKIESLLSNDNPNQTKDEKHG